MHCCHVKCCPCPCSASPLKIGRPIKQFGDVFDLVLVKPHDKMTSETVVVTSTATVGVVCAVETCRLCVDLSTRRPRMFSLSCGMTTTSCDLARPDPQVAEAGVTMQVSATDVPGQNVVRGQEAIVNVFAVVQ